MILYVDTKILKNNVNPSIKESKKKLNSAKAIVSKIKVPEGFASTNKLKKSIPKRITDVDTDMGDLYKFVSKKIDSFTNAGKNIISMGKTNLLKFGVKITASSVNECLSLVKGLGNFAESLLDTGATIAAVGVTPIAGLSDLINYLTGNEVSAVDELWRGTKGLIANEVVNSAFKDLYENYEFGKWLDENAFKPYKSTGAIPRLTEGIGELAGTALLTLFTAGAGAAANPATASKLFTLLRGLTGAGKAFQDYWSDSSGDLEGKENLVDTLKGLGYGTLTGGWESLQAYIGGDTLKGIQVLKNQFLNSLVRIGIDTGFNMADTPYRSLMDVIFKGKEWNEAWKDQGGWTSLLINGGIGFIGSTFGEIAEYSTNKQKNHQRIIFDDDTQYKIQSKTKIRFKNADEGLQIAKDYMNDDFDYIESVTGYRYVSREELEDAFKHVHILSKKDWHNFVIEKDLGFFCGGVNIRGEIYVPEGESVSTVIHEVNHTLGIIRDTRTIPLMEGEWRIKFKNNNDCRGINEAFTERNSLIQCGMKSGDSSYQCNVDVLDKIFDSLNGAGYGNMDYNAYYITSKKSMSTNGANVFADIVDTISGDGTFAEITRLMDIADGCGKTKGIINTTKAKFQLNAIAKQFEIDCKDINRWAPQVNSLLSLLYNSIRR